MKLKKLKEHIIKAAVWSIVVMTCFMTIQMFVVLKLTGTVDWSWWWIAAPLWLPVAAVVGLAALSVVVAIAAYVIRSRGGEDGDEAIDESLH